MDRTAIVKRRLHSVNQGESPSYPVLSRYTQTNQSGGKLEHGHFSVEIIASPGQLSAKINIYAKHTRKAWGLRA